MEAGTAGLVEPDMSNAAPSRGGRPSKREVELAERVAVLEARQTEIINVIAGVSQAGGWLKQQIELGQA